MLALYNTTRKSREKKARVLIRYYILVHGHLSRTGRPAGMPGGQKKDNTSREVTAVCPAHHTLYIVIFTLYTGITCEQYFATLLAHRHVTARCFNTRAISSTMFHIVPHCRFALQMYNGVQCAILTNRSQRPLHSVVILPPLNTASPYIRT